LMAGVVELPNTEHIQCFPLIGHLIQVGALSFFLPFMAVSLRLRCVSIPFG
jgi:hypothetical protein